MDNSLKTPADDGRVVAEVEDETVPIPAETNAELVFGKLRDIIREHGKALVDVRRRGPAFSHGDVS